MSMRIEDFLQFDYFKDLQLIAGKTGLSHTVTCCGILDYELDRDLNGKYARANFLPNQLVITSLLFAKDNPFLLNDVVKYLISKDCSGLIIKNVFQITIHDSILRYADAKGFPIFLADRKKIFFEDFIIQTTDFLKSESHNERAEKSISQLLYEPLSKEERDITAHHLLPRLRSQYISIHIRFDDVPPQMTLESQWCSDDWIPVLYRFAAGYFLILTRDLISVSDPEFQHILGNIREKYPDCQIGISSVYYLPENLCHTLRESVYASAIQQIEQSYGPIPVPEWTFYDSIGVYRALIPLRDTEAVQTYMQRIIEPIIEFDAKNQSILLDTLLNFISCKGNLHLLTQKMNQHENTLRYRLGKISEITALNYRVSSNYEELAFAARIFLLSRIRIL